MVESFRQKIETIIRGENPPRTFCLRCFLLAVSQLYGAVVKVRAAGYRTGFLQSRKLPCPVISIGNITVGGTGKTPLTVYVAEQVHRMGFQAVVVSRGYKSGAERSGGIVSDGNRLQMALEMAGDEPTLIAMRLLGSSVPVLVGQNRYRIGQMALELFNPDVIILDDGFQHTKLARDINMVLLDSRYPFGNRHLLPRGVLRESISSLARANMFILTRSDPGRSPASSEDLTLLDVYSRCCRTYRARHIPMLREFIPADKCITAINLFGSVPKDIEQLKQRKAFAFSGIAVNNHFRQTLKDLQCNLRGFIEFKDHHFYSNEDIERILQSAKVSGADCLCTTDKDFVRIGVQEKWPLDLAVIGVDISFGEDKADFISELNRRLAALT
jgi:tetraacyldisaccharide 4'-kinase